MRKINLLMRAELWTDDTEDASSLWKKIGKDFRTSFEAILDASKRNDYLYRNNTVQLIMEESTDEANK